MSVLNKYGHICVLGTLVTIGFALALAAPDDVISRSHDRQPRAPRWCRKPQLPYGKVRMKNGNTLAYFKCKRRFQLIGPKLATCIQGSWSVPPPHCVKKGCPEIPTTAHLQVHYVYNDAVAQFACPIGYSRVGSFRLFCNGKNWNAGPPVCQRQPATKAIEVTTTQAETSPSVRTSVILTTETSTPAETTPTTGVQSSTAPTRQNIAQSSLRPTTLQERVTDSQSTVVSDEALVTESDAPAAVTSKVTLNTDLSTLLGVVNSSTPYKPDNASQVDLEYINKNENVTGNETFPGDSEEYKYEIENVTGNETVNSTSTKPNSIPTTKATIPPTSMPFPTSYGSSTMDDCFSVRKSTTDTTATMQTESPTQYPPTIETTSMKMLETEMNTLKEHTSTQYAKLTSSSQEVTSPRHVQNLPSQSKEQSQEDGLFAGLMTAIVIVSLGIIAVVIWLARWLRMHRTVEYDITKDEEFHSVPYSDPPATVNSDC